MGTCLRAASASACIKTHAVRYASSARGGRAYGDEGGVILVGWLELTKATDDMARAPRVALSARWRGSRTPDERLQLPGYPAITGRCVVTSPEEELPVHRVPRQRAERRDQVNKRNALGRRDGRHPQQKHIRWRRIVFCLQREVYQDQGAASPAVRCGELPTTAAATSKAVLSVTESAAMPVW
jgi:hypothetical protein